MRVFDEATVIVEARAEARQCVIWLHGLGADGNDFVPIARELALPQLKYIFPHAPYRGISMNMGYQMRAWYDLHGLSAESREDEAGILESSNYVNGLIEAQHQAGFAYKDIFLAGFSQGGAIALYAGLRFPQALAGILALSTYLPLGKSLEGEVSSHAKNTPIFMAHGTQDEIVSPHLAELSVQAMATVGLTVNIQEYPMAHSVCPEEINDIRTFLDA